MNTLRRRFAALCLVTSAVIVSMVTLVSTSTLPLLGQAGLRYVGGFRVPAGTFGGSSFGYVGTGMAYNPANNSLFMVGHDWNQQVAEISIPTPVNSSSLDALPIAAVLQPFADPTDGRLQSIGTDVKIGGLMVAGNQLYVTGFVYYDASGSQNVSHFVRSTNLSTASARGPFGVNYTGAVAGPMVPVPPDWQGALGSPQLSAQCCIPILSRSSYGPSGFGVDLAQLGQVSPLPSTALLFYPQTHPLDTWDGTSKLFNGTTKMGGMVFPVGSGSLLWIGRQGVGTFCYGNGSTQNPPPTGECYDPTDSSKGNHAYPYVYQVWAYAASDLAAVKAGSKQSWELRPYATWQLQFPTTTWSSFIQGVAYDPARQRLYVSQAFADGERPVIHAFDLDLTAPSTPTAPANLRIVK